MKEHIINLENFIEEIKLVHDRIDEKILTEAFAFSKQAHKKQKRLSGEPFISHPANVAYILATLKTDTATIIAGLLHDILEDTDFVYEDLAEKFGTEIADLVEGVTKLEHFKYKTNLTQKEKQAENFRKLLISVTKDIRVILIKFADRLHNMRTIEHLEKSKIKRITEETLDIYVPLVNRFGIAKIKWELEDLCLKYLHPQEYQQIVEVIKEKRNERDEYLEAIIKPIKQFLKEAKIEAEVHGRSKHFYSIYRKKITRKVSYEDFFDFAAIRIVVDTVEQCYTSLGLIHAKYEPIERRFRDYIARPKSNNYQSLHTVVIGPKGKKVEIQIRTHQMHLIAEEGIAAHWRYKELQEYSDKTYLKEIKKNALHESFEGQINWIRNLLNQKSASNSSDFIEMLRLNLYPEIIVAISPNGDFIKLPKNATPVDFAFSIHTNVGLRCIGAKVNGRMVPIRSVLQSGDMVEIITSPRGNPSKDWLKFLKTSKARQKVRNYFHQKELEDAIYLGKEIFEKKCRKFHYKFKDKKEYSEIFRRFKINNIKSLFTLLGKGEILFSQIREIIDEKELERIHDLQVEIEDLSVDEQLLEETRQKVQGIKIDEIDNLMLNYAKCCHPLPGDEIVGYTTRGRGITIHRADCINPGFLYSKKKEPERILPIQWNFSSKQKKQNKIHSAKIKVTGDISSNFMLDILNRFSKLKIALDDAQVKKVSGKTIGTFAFKVKDETELQKIVNEIKEIKNVHYIRKIKV